MRVFPRALVLATALLAIVPRFSHADTIIATVGDATTFSGALDTLNEVEFFQFTLTDGAFNFVATTDSIAAGGGFDPELTLYLGDQIYTYPDGAGGTSFAKEDDSPTTATGIDASLSLLLTTPGIYTLALAHTQNFSHETLGFDWDEIADVMGELYPGVSCDPGGPTFGPYCANSTYSLFLSITPATSEPVPEPGTLSLIGIGISALVLRRRRRVETRSIDS